MTADYPTVSRSRRNRVAGRWRQGRAPWPDGVRCVVAITIDFDGPSNEVGCGHRPLGIRSAGRYSGRRGVPRYLEMLGRLGIPATFFIPGYDAECFPDSVRDIAREGHEIGAHGYLHEGVLLPAEEEERRLVLTHRILTGLTGKPPVGWRSPSGRKTHATLPVLRRLGYLYDSSDKDFDLPYLLDLGDGVSIVEIPNNTFSLDDYPWYRFSMTPVSEVLGQWRQEFASIYSDRGFFILLVHPRSGWGSGTPSRTAAMESLIRFIRSHDGVRFVTLEELCHWVAARPAEFEEVRI